MFSVRCSSWSSVVTIKFEIYITGWWQLKYSLFFTLNPGEMIQFWRAYFSNGLKPPTIDQDSCSLKVLTQLPLTNAGGARVPCWNRHLLRWHWLQEISHWTVRFERTNKAEYLIGIDRNLLYFKNGLVGNTGRHSVFDGMILSSKSSATNILIFDGSWLIWNFWSKQFFTQNTVHLRRYCWWFRNPKQPPGMVKSPVDNGIKYQPQLVKAGFLPSTVWPDV